MNKNNKTIHRVLHEWKHRINRACHDTIHRTYILYLQCSDFSNLPFCAMAIELSLNYLVAMQFYPDAWAERLEISERAGKLLFFVWNRQLYCQFSFTKNALPSNWFSYKISTNQHLHPLKWPFGLRYVFETVCCLLILRS